MKRIISAVLALSLLGAPAAFAKGDKGDKGEKHGDHGYSQDFDRGEHHDNGNHYGQIKHRWARGERLPVTYYQNRNYYVDYRVVHLRAPPPGYQWVQVDNNYAMVALATGLIASLIAHN